MTNPPNEEKKLKMETFCARCGRLLTTDKEKYGGSHNCVKAMLKEFDEDFREYLHASIAYAELQVPYRALDVEDEIKWIKNWLKENVNP